MQVFFSQNNFSRLKIIWCIQIADKDYYYYHQQSLKKQLVLYEAKKSNSVTKNKSENSWVARGSLFTPTYRPTHKNDHHRWQIALALIPPLEVHGALEW